MYPRFRRRPSHLLLDDLASQPLFELGEFRSLSQDVPLEYISPQDVAILPPEEAADDGACRYARDEEEVEPHGSPPRTGRGLARAELQELVGVGRDAPSAVTATRSVQKSDK